MNARSPTNGTTSRRSHTSGSHFEVKQTNGSAPLSGTCNSRLHKKHGIRPVFKADFAAFSYDKLIIDGLAKLTHRPNENPRMFFSRLEELVFVQKENYASYRVKPDRPAYIQPQGTYTEDALTKYANDSIDAFPNFLFTQMFKAAAPENVRRLLSNKDQLRLTVEEAYKVFFTDHRMEMDKKLSTVHAVTGEFENPAHPEQEKRN
jgi:hypothetical protein